MPHKKNNEMKNWNGNCEIEMVWDERDDNSVKWGRNVNAVTVIPQHIASKQAKHTLQCDRE